MLVSELYPSIGYWPELRHCAFVFSGLFKIAPQYEIPKDSILPMEKLVRLSHEYYDDKKRLFPKSEDIIKSFSKQELTFCQKFSGLDEKVSYIDNNSRMTINLPAMIYAPSMHFNNEHGLFLEVELHNCATPDMAVVMYTHGLNALRKIYEAYEIDADFLPELKFDSEGIQIQVPFRVPEIDILKKYNGRGSIRESVINHLKTQSISYSNRKKIKAEIFPEKDYFGKVAIDGISLEPIYENEEKKAGKFVSKIAMKLPKISRNSLAADLLNIAIIQSVNMYRAIDYCK
jgi:hypothetical protein